MREKKAEVIVALIIIAIGVLGVLNQGFGIQLFGYISIWDLAICGLGLYFEWLYFSEKKSPGFLVPGGILTVVGLCDFLEALCGGLFFGHFPAGEIGVALGLFQLYWFGKRNKWLLIPVGIMILAAIDELADHFFGWFNSSLIWPIALICLGLILLFGRGKKEEI